MIAKPSSKKSNQLWQQTDQVSQPLTKYLSQEFSKHDFAERVYYGDTYFAAALALRNENPALQGKLLTMYKKREKQNPSKHNEFNLYALQEYSYATGKTITTDLRFDQFYFRKVSNWVLLRSLVRIRSGKSFIALSQIFSILLLNRSGGYITDNTIRSLHHRKQSISSQYHAFATCLLGEISQFTKHKWLSKQFMISLDLLIHDHKATGLAINHGRGKEQIFGYAAYLYSLAMAFQQTGDEKYAELFSETVNYLQSWQRPDGSMPISLTIETPDKDYYTYLNEFDYQPFLLFYLEKSKTLFAKL